MAETMGSRPLFLPRGEANESTVIQHVSTTQKLRALATGSRRPDEKKKRDTSQTKMNDDACLHIALLMIVALLKTKHVVPKLA